MSTDAPQLFIPTNSTAPVEIVQKFILETTAGTISTNSVQPTFKEATFNGTGYFIDDEVEPGLNDLQTLFLACFATLIPLIISLFTAFGIRILWTKYKRRRDCSNYDGVLHKDESSSEPLSRPLHSHLLNSDKIKCGETHLSIGTEDVEVCGGTRTAINSCTQSLRGNNHSSTNGSIITMTLKNNHLIVETEERNDLEEDSRETTMKYSPGARDGVFVVEVQQGVRRSPGSGGQASCADPKPSISISDQCALVHNPPDRYSDEETLEEGDENEYYMETVSPNRDTPDSSQNQIRTGLTRSNLSLTSGHHSYCYGNQQGYETGNLGYSVYSGYMSEDRASPKPVLKPENNNKPKITSALYKKKASLDALSDGPLLSDLMAKVKAEENDPIQEEQNRLGNSISGKNQEPVISQIKQHIFNAVSPKFEKLKNESTAKSADYENKGFDAITKS